MTEWITHTSHHQSIKTDRGILNYWPTTGKYRLDNKTREGDIESLCNDLDIDCPPSVSKLVDSSENGTYIGDIVHIASDTNLPDAPF